MSWTGDWADWAGDHPEQAEAELRKAMGRSRVIGQIGEATYYEVEQCEHEEIDNQGVCEDCGDEVEGWEPNDIQIFSCYGPSKVPGEVAA